MLEFKHDEYITRTFKENNFELVFFVYPIWQDFITKHEILLKSVAFKALNEVNLDINQQRTDSIHITFCDNKMIHQLNKQYRNHDNPTNVLSFPAYSLQELSDKEYLFGEYQVFGDIFISYDYCYDEANQTQKPFDNHIAHMLVHGTLHLFGFDHQEPRDADIMESLEATILKTFNIDSPY